MIRFLIDENLRGRFWQSVQANGARSDYPLDAVCVGSSDAVPLGMLDPDILRWIEKNDRILITLDKRTMALHLNDHLRAGGHVPGIFTLRMDFRHAEVLEYLTTVAYASDPEEWLDRIEYIP